MTNLLIKDLPIGKELNHKAMAALHGGNGGMGQAAGTGPINSDPFMDDGDMAVDVSDSFSVGISVPGMAIHFNGSSHSDMWGSDPCHGQSVNQAAAAGG